MNRYLMILLILVCSVFVHGCANNKLQAADVEAVCEQRLAKWERCYQVEVKLDDGISNWKFEYLDLQRKELYSLINDMGGVYEERDKRRPISTCKKDMISFFSIPANQDPSPIPGVLLVAPLRQSGFATFFAIDSKGNLACGAIEFSTSYCTGGAVYTPDAPGVAFSTGDWKKKDRYSQYRISPGKELKKHFASASPVEWTLTEKVVGTYKLFAEPIVPKEYGHWVRLDNIDKLAKKLKKQDAEQENAPDKK